MGTFYTYLYVDGVFKTSWSTASLNADFYTYANDFSIGSLTAGTHTITITTDETGVIAESNEGDNSYTKTITVNSPSQPNLTPYLPPDWSDKIVIARTTGTTIDSTSLTTSDTLYVNWAVVNNGNATASSFYNSLYVDGIFKNSWFDSSLAPSFYTYVNDYSIGSLSPGTHTITITADSGLSVSESNESDNSYTKTITILTPLPDLTKNTDSLNNSSPHPGDTVTASLTMQNQPCTSGNANAGAFHVGFYFSTSSSFIGASPFHETAVSGCAANSTVSLNQNIIIDPSTSPGTYYLGYKIDDENEVAECTENNNGIFYWTVTVVGLADLTPQNISVTPDPATIGGSVTVNYTVANIGGTAAPASHTKIQIKNASNVLLTQQTFSTAGIAANSSTNESRVLSLAGASAGTYYAYVIVDNNSEVDQGSNTNNDLSSGASFNVLTQSGFVINPIFDSSIVNDPQAATIEATINSAIAVYESNFSNQITVSIKFQEMSSGLGESTKYYDKFAYSDYIAALVSHATTADDATALAYLPNSVNNPVNGNQDININLPLARALGFNANPPAGQPDGTIGLNTSILNLSAAQTDPTKYSLFADVSHEIDEVLGFASSLDSVKNNNDTLTGPVSPEDLFRYDQNGARSYTTNINATSYFSLDGITDLAQFNQVASGDFGDWYSYYGGQTPQVQDAFGTPGSTPVLGVELRCLDVIGFSLVSSSPKSNQTITFEPLANKTFGEPSFAVSATASSGLSVNFNILSGPATLSGNNVTLAGTGTVVVRASQGGNASYNPAPNVDQSFTIYAPPAVHFGQQSANLILTWPTNVAGFTLQTTTNLAVPNSWTTALPPPVIVNGQYTFTNTSTVGNKFYRLEK